MLNRLTARCVLVCFLLAVGCAAQDEKVDLDMVSKIRYEGFRNSKIMEIASGLMDGIGQRLTGSPNVKRANEWTRDKLSEFGLVNAHLEAWSPFGRGWANQYVNVRMLGPDIATLIAYPRAWTPGTNDAIQAQVVRVEIHPTPGEMARDMAKYKGKLAGKIILYGDDPELKLPAEPLVERLDEKALSQIEQYPIPSERNDPRIREFQRRGRLLRAIAKFFADEQVAAVIEHSRGSIGGGTVYVDGGAYKVGQTVGVPWLIMAAEHWTRIARLLQQKKDVQLEVNVKNTFYDDAMTQFDTIAEIPGSDKKDEVVMLGAHLDSWWTGTGATDNGAGTVVMMEAVRILKALGIKPRRTIRIGLWTGEEQGLLGSQWYVAHHFGSRPPSKDPDREGDPTVWRRDTGPMSIKPAEQSKVSVYFNVDNGSGKIRGVFLQENAAVAPIFKEWMKPFHDLGMETLAMRNTGGTDHLSFDAVGIPGFQFIQDPLDYGTRTHHSNMDVYDRLQADDLKQMAVVVATFVYNAAMRDQMFPRKPIEKELPPPPPQEDEQAAPAPPMRPGL
ncbi:MAG TPA: M20/M25/M40 family metallo-hydrolase [Candidatus Angelobacter sp.]